MKRIGLLIATAIGLSPNSVAQVQQVIQPVVLIEGTRGSGPGAYALEFGQTVPHCIVIDDQENIFILDTFNNRLQHYDDKGKFVGAISIPSTSETTAAERKGAPLLPKIIPAVDSVEFINGSLYAMQQRNAEDSGHLLRRQGNSFVNADGDKNVAEIRKMLFHRDQAAWRRKELQANVLQLGMTEEEFIARFPREKRRHRLYNVYFDMAKNIWAIGDGIRVYNPSGALIYEHEEVVRLAYTLSGRGNLYVMTFYSHIPMTRDNWSDGSVDGVRVVKYSLEGK
jgi:hypothetical protein